MLRVGQEGRVLLVDGQVVHGKAVVSVPVLVVVVRGRALEAGAEAEADVDGLAGPRREVKLAKVVGGEVLPAVVGAEEVDTVVEARLCSPAVELLEGPLVVEAAPKGGAGAAGAGEQCFRGAPDGAPAGLVAADFDDGEVVPDVVDHETVGVSAAKGAEPKMLVEFNAHEGTVGVGQVHVFEDHRVVPVLAVAGP